MANELLQTNTFKVVGNLIKADTALRTNPDNGEQSISVTATVVSVVENKSNEFTIRLYSKALTKDGNFERIIIKSGTTFQRGDILVKHISGSNGHTVVYLGNNQIAEACNKKYGLRITTYYPNGYQYLLRYTGASINKVLPPMIRKGSKNIYVGIYFRYYSKYLPIRGSRK